MRFGRFTERLRISCQHAVLRMNAGARARGCHRLDLALMKNSLEQVSQLQPAAESVHGAVMPA